MTGKCPKLLCALAIAARMLSAQSTTPAVAPDDLNQIRQRIADQEEQIKKLQQAVEEQRTLLDEAVKKAAAAQPASAVADASTAPVKMVPVVNVAHPDIANGQKNETAPTSPLSIRIGDATITPLGFVDFTMFGRTTNVGSGIGTNFAGIPLKTAAGSNLSELNFSAQNSRIGFRVDSTVFGAQVLGYLEADFQFNNNANSFQITSNSAGFRLRNYFVDVEKNGFEVLAGQDWSLLTPNRNGLSPVPSDIFYTQNEDTNYQVGLIWTRQPQIRFIAHPNDNIAFGVSLENPQQYIGGGSGAGVVTLPSAISTALGTQFQSGSATTGNSITGIPNLFPDIVAKVAFDGHPGDRTMHFEVAGLISGFKDFIPTKITGVPTGTHTAIGYGAEANFNLELAKNFHFIMNNFASEGGGRYIFGIGPDVVVQPNGTITPLHAYSTADGFELNLTKKTLLALYYGGAYVDRDAIFDSTAAGSTLAKPVYVGYGYVGSSASNNRTVQEATADVVQTLWKNPSYGALSLILQYSYLWRDPWSVAAGTPTNTSTNMWYLDVRYTLP